jgi:hypothetical protein
MHQQLKFVPRLSPPDLEKALGVLKDAGVNLVGAGGSDLEFGGELIIAPQDGQFDDAKKALVDAGYEPTELEADKDFKLCWLTNDAGQLYDCIAEEAAANLANGKVIQHIIIGVERDKKDRIPVAVYSVEIRSAANTG